MSFTKNGLRGRVVDLEMIASRFLAELVDLKAGSICFEERMVE